MDILQQRAAACNTSTATGYTIVPNSLRTLGLTPRQEQLVHRLLEFARPGQSPFPSMRLLAERMHCKVRTVQTTMRSLERLGLVTTQPWYRESDKGQTSNVYHLAPILTTILAPVVADPGTGSSEQLHPPVQPPAVQEEYVPKKTAFTRRNQGIIQPGECAGCGSREHVSEMCPTYGHVFRR